MKIKISLIIFLTLFSVTAHAATIYSLPDEEGFFAKVWRCTWHISCYKQKLGATITTINSSDTLKDSRAVINTNFSNLNSDKTEVASSSIAAITTLSNLVTVGTLTSGSLGSGFTTVVVARGGTGSTTLSSNSVLLGNGTGNVSVVAGLGSSGQTLQSQGAGSPPQWAADTTDQTANYTWTGTHTFATSTMSSTTAYVLNAGTITATSTLTLPSGTSLTSGSVPFIRAGSNTTEVCSSLSSNTNLQSLTGLSITAATPFRLLFNIRRASGGTANGGNFDIEVNNTVITGSSTPFSTDTTNAESGLVSVDFGPRVSNYLFSAI